MSFWHRISRKLGYCFGKYEQTNEHLGRIRGISGLASNIKRKSWQGNTVKAGIGSCWSWLCSNEDSWWTVPQRRESRETNIQVLETSIERCIGVAPPWSCINIIELREKGRSNLSVSVSCFWSVSCCSDALGKPCQDWLVQSNKLWYQKHASTWRGLSWTNNWLVVLTILKNICQWEGLSRMLWKIKNVWNHQPDKINSF